MKIISAAIERQVLCFDLLKKIINLYYFTKFIQIKRIIYNTKMY